MDFKDWLSEVLNSPSIAGVWGWILLVVSICAGVVTAFLVWNALPPGNYIRLVLVLPGIAGGWITLNLFGGAIYYFQEVRPLRRGPRK